MKSVSFQTFINPGVFRVILLLSCISILFGCYSHSGFDYPKELPEDFEFKAIWHFEGWVIDSRENTFTKAISYDTDTTISFKLTEAQQEQIYKIMKDIDVFGYPEDFVPSTTTQVLPSTKYYLEVEINGVSKKINWEQNVYSSTKRAKRLRRFFDLLDDMLDASAAIQALPKDERMFF